jgi:tetratricopeptide (TPR) repeat protein
LADAFPISGQIDPKAFPFLLVDLHRNGATGSLKVEGPSYQKALYFRGGRILFGSSNDPRDQLGAILIESGKITPEQLEDVSAKMGPGSPLAKVLADTGFVNQRELSEAAQVKVERILSDVLSYDVGGFEFEDGVLPKGAVDLKLSTERLVMSAVRRLTDRNFVLRHLEGLDVVFAPSLQATGVVPELDSETENLLEEIDGEASLKEAAARSRLDEFEAAKIACALLFLGVIQRAQPHASLVPGAPPPLAFVPSDADGPELDLTATVRAAFKMEPKTEPEPPILLGRAPEDVPPIALPAPAPVRPSLSIPDRVAPPPPTPPPPPRVLPPVELPPPAPRVVAPPPSTPASPRMTTPPPREDRLPLVPPPPRTVTPEPVVRPSRDDLAAVDALLNSESVEGPMAAFEKTAIGEASWAPAFTGRQSVGGGARRSSSRAPMLVLVGLVVLAALGGGAWYYLRVRPGKTVPAPPPPTVARSLPPATTLATTPATVASTQPAAAVAAAPTARAAVATPVPPPPSTQPARSTGPLSLAQSRTLMRQGQLTQAAHGFETNVKGAPPGTLSVQLLVACAPETVQKALDGVHSDELFILPAHYNGRDCFRTCCGLYDAGQGQLRDEGPAGILPRGRRQAEGGAGRVPAAVRAHFRAGAMTAALCVAGAAGADTITLTNGHVIEADRAWFEGTQLRYEKNGGVYGLPRSIVKDVEQRQQVDGAQDPDVARARQRLAAHDPVQATRLLRAAVARDPHNVAALHALAEAYLALGDARSAKEAAERALKLDLRDARALELLGDALVGLGDREGAEQEYRRSVQVRPDSAVQRKLQEVSPAPSNPAAGATFTLRYDGGVNQPMGSAVLETLTTAHAEYSRRFGFRPDEPISVILETEAAFQDERVPDWAAGVNDGAIHVPVRGLDKPTPRVIAVLRHELAHSFVAARTRGNCPTWLHEGIAQWLEGGDPGREDAAVATALRGGHVLPLITLEAPFLTLPPTDVTLAYAESLSAVGHILRKRTDAGVIRLLAALGDGFPSEEALPIALALSYPEFQKSWEDELRGGDSSRGR